MTYRHKKTGHVYSLIMICTRESDLTPVAIYSDVNTGMIWERPASEFFDGRYEVVVPTQPAVERLH